MSWFRLTYIFVLPHKHHTNNNPSIFQPYPDQHRYLDYMQSVKSKIENLVEYGKEENRNASKPLTMINMDGEWELIISSVRHGIFRSSPFFLAIQEAYRKSGNPEKADLFFKLHELQTMSWGVSKIGRVGQYINSTTGTLSSEFDTSIFSLTVIPLVGWGKLLPTFGGRIITESKAKMSDLEGEKGKLLLEVDYTTAKKVEGLNSLPGGIGIGTYVYSDGYCSILFYC